MLAALNLCKQATALLLAQPPMLPAGGRSRPAARGETTHPISSHLLPSSSIHPGAADARHPSHRLPLVGWQPRFCEKASSGARTVCESRGESALPFDAPVSKIAATLRFLHSSSSNHRRSCLQIPQPIHRETNPRRPTSRPTIPRPSHPHTCCLIRAPPDNPLGHPRVADPRLIRARDGAQAHASPP